MKPDAQKVTDFTCDSSFLGSRNLAASRVRSDYPVLLVEVYLPLSHEPLAP